jgi:hypothetical protein
VVGVSVGGTGVGVFVGGTGALVGVSVGSGVFVIVGAGVEVGCPPEPSVMLSTGRFVDELVSRDENATSSVESVAKTKA